jgi:hypothetical protein
MAGALAAAVERLRARAEEPVPDGIREQATVPGAGGPVAVEPRPAVSATATGRAERPRPSRPVAPPRPPVPLPAAAQVPPVRADELARHKHSLSLIKRWRIRRKQRRRR